LRRGELYRVRKANARDPKEFRVFVVVSRQMLIETRFPTVVCAPIYTAIDGYDTQVALGVENGLKHDSAIHCDELVSLPKNMLTDYVGHLSGAKLAALNIALGVALDLS